MMSALWDLTICAFVISAIDSQFKAVLRSIVIVPDCRQVNLKLRRAWSTTSVFLLVYWLCLLPLLNTLSQRFHNPNTTFFLLVSAQISFTLSEVLFYKDD